MKKVVWSPTGEHEHLSNLKVLQVALARADVQRPINILELARCRLPDMVEFGQWLKQFLDEREVRQGWEPGRRIARCRDQPPATARSEPGGGARLAAARRSPSGQPLDPDSTPWAGPSKGGRRSRGVAAGRCALGPVQPRSTGEVTPRSAPGLGAPTHGARAPMDRGAARDGTPGVDGSNGKGDGGGSSGGDGFADLGTFEYRHDGHLVPAARGARAEGLGQARGAGLGLHLGLTQGAGSMEPAAVEGPRGGAKVRPLSPLTQEMRRWNIDDVWTAGGRHGGGAATAARQEEQQQQQVAASAPAPRPAEAARGSYAEGGPLRRPRRARPRVGPTPAAEAGRRAVGRREAPRRAAAAEWEARLERIGREEAEVLRVLADVDAELRVRRQQAVAGPR